MDVKIEIEENLKEPYAVIHTKALTTDIQEMVHHIHSFTQEEKRIIGKKKDRMFFFLPAEIEVIRSEGGQLKLYTQNAESYDVTGPLKNLLVKLGNDFIQISKAAIINIKSADHVFPYFNGVMVLVLKNGLEEYISRSYLPDFKKRLGM